MYDKITFCGHKGYLHRENNTVCFYNLIYNTILDCRSLLEFLEPNKNYKCFKYRGIHGVINKETGTVHVDCHTIPNRTIFKQMVKDGLIK